MVKGRRVGDYELGTSLRDVLFSLDTLVRDNGNRTDIGLFGLDGGELFSVLDSALYGYEESQYEKKAIQESWARFNVVLPVDVFDNYKIYLVENYQTSRMLIKHVSDDEPQDVMFPKGMFDEVIYLAHQELDNLYSNEVDNC